jgi:hypothetical protein
MTAALVFTFGCGSNESSSAEAKSPQAKAKPAPTKAAPQKAAPKGKADTAATSVSGMKVVKAWDFTKPDKAKVEWRFPGIAAADVETTPRGVVFPATASNPGPFINQMNVAAADVKAVRVHLSAVKVVKGKETPQPIKGLRWMWARKDVDGIKPGDFFASGFDHNKRRVAFEVPNKDKPNVYVVKLQGHPAWNKTIEKAFIDVMFDEPIKNPAEGAYRIYAKSIEFLK